MYCHNCGKNIELKNCLSCLTTCHLKEQQNRTEGKERILSQLPIKSVGHRSSSRVCNSCGTDNTSLNTADCYRCGHRLR